MENQTRRLAIKNLSAVTAGTLMSHNQETTMENNTGSTPFVLREKEGRFNEVYHLMGMDKFLKVSGKDTNGQLALFYGLYVKNDSAPLHVHYKEDEVFYILEGEFVVQVGNEKYTLKAGDSVFLPRNIPHTYLALTDNARMLFMTTPAGKQEALFKQLSQMDATATPADFRKVLLAHDQDIVGPPLKA